MSKAWSFLWLVVAIIIVLSIVLSLIQPFLPFIVFLVILGTVIYIGRKVYHFTTERRRHF